VGKIVKVPGTGSKTVLKLYFYKCETKSKKNSCERDLFCSTVEQLIKSSRRIVWQKRR
jgi:hypothetical protein